MTSDEKVRKEEVCNHDWETTCTQIPSEGYDAGTWEKIECRKCGKVERDTYPHGDPTPWGIFWVIAVMVIIILICAMTFIVAGVLK